MMLFYELIQVALDSREILSKTPSEQEWATMFEMSKEQAIAGVAYFALDKIASSGQKPPLDVLFDWIGFSQQIKANYLQCEKATRDLTDILKEGGYNIMVLKGHGLALNYPEKELRPSGDLDIWSFGREREVDEYLASKGLKIDYSHHHHSVFQFEDITIENHYDFINIYTRPSSREIESRLKELAIGEEMTLDDGTVCFPSADFNALFLLMHCANHFLCNEMTVRHILDWGLFFMYHHKEISWDEYMPYIKRMGIFRFYNLLGLFCMRNLGINASIFHGLYDDAIFNRFSNDIISPEFQDKENGSLIYSLWVKPRRWWHNRWKSRLCYRDSLVSIFFYGIWGKILKPSHFIH